MSIITLLSSLKGALDAIEAADAPETEPAPELPRPYRKIPRWKRKLEEKKKRSATRYTDSEEPEDE